MALEKFYGLTMPTNEREAEGREAEGWTPGLLCEALAIKRGLLLARTGAPDTHAAGLRIIRDVADGVLPLAFDVPLAIAGGVLGAPANTTPGQCAAGQCDGAAQGAGAAPNGLFDECASSTLDDCVEE